MVQILYSFFKDDNCQLMFISRKYQQRLPYDLLSSLANSLLDGTVFEIVRSLQEVQQLEERHLHTQRVKLVNDHKGITKHSFSLVSTCNIDTRYVIKHERLLVLKKILNRQSSAFDYCIIHFQIDKIFAKIHFLS